MARKCKLTPAVQEQIVQALHVGATHEIACGYAGINPDTFYAWMRKGAEGRAPFSEFSEAVQKAEQQAVVGWLATIEQAARAGHWQAAAWKLERRYPKDYGRTVQEHHVSGTVTLSIAQKTRDANDRIERLRRASTGLLAG